MVNSRRNLWSMVLWTAHVWRFLLWFFHYEDIILLRILTYVDIYLSILKQTIVLTTIFIFTDSSKLWTFDQPFWKIKFIIDLLISLCYGAFQSVTLSKSLKKIIIIVANFSIFLLCSSSRSASYNGTLWPRVRRRENKRHLDLWPYPG